GLERPHVRRGNRFGEISQPFESAMHQLFVFPRQAAEKQRGVPALAPGERLLHRTLELMDFAFVKSRFLLQARALFCEALLDHVLDRSADLDEVRWLGDLGFKRLCAHSYPLLPVFPSLRVSCRFNRLKEI